MRAFASNGMKARNVSRFVFFAVSLFSISVFAQSPVTNPMKSHDVKFDLNSGQIYHNGEEAAVVWSDEITVKGALWLRLNFRQLVLAGSPLGGPSSTLRITSLNDGAFQILNSDTALQWRNTSAYFNGGSLRLELIAAPNGRMNQIVVDEVTVGDFDGVSVSETICDDVDDRELSDDPRNGRTAPGGCTGWLFDDRNNCMLTAGHCQASNEVMLFNVPLSDANGNRQFPPPEDQYAVDFDSVQFVNGGVGNDWCYFGCFPNANTGLTAFEAQGDSYELAEPGDIQPGDMIRITGFGSTSFPVNPMWNGAQKTQVGPYALFTDDEIGYRTDTTGGNSGSPVVLESTGQAIGIHTHGGCGSGGNGVNLGTGLLQNGVSNALDNPEGICVLTVNFSYPDGRPESIEIDGSTSLRVVIDDSDFELANATAMLNVDDGSGYQPIAMTALGGGVFEASFPVIKCGTVVDYFVSIESTEGVPFTDPVNAPPNSYNALAAVSVDSAFVDDFESDQGWSVTGDASTGQWQRGVPNGGGDRGDPGSDADGSGNCFVTQNGPGDTDVDNGSTVLASPIIDATIAGDQTAILSYFRWLDNGGDGDPMVVELSNNGGASWTLVETIDMGNDAQGGWRLVNIDVANFVPATNQMRVRFTVSDTGPGSIVEAGVDGVRIRVVNCEKDFLLGDVNLDGTVNLLDVQPFVDLILNGGFQLEADINGDGEVNLLDVELFVVLISG